MNNLFKINLYKLPDDVNILKLMKQNVNNMNFI